MAQEDSRQVYSVITKLIQDFQTCDDEYVIYRLYAIASRVLEADFVVKSILDHQSQSSNLRARLRLSWAYHWNLDMRDESRNATFWEGASSYFWAASWWNEAISNSKATNVLAPSELHQKLVVKFAMSTLEDLLPRDTEFVKPLSNWAVWKLLSYVQILSFSFSFREDVILSKIKQEIYSIPSLNDLDFSGLDESVSITIRYLLDLYSKLLNSIIEKSSESFLEILYINISDLLTHLRYGGLSSLVTLQCIKVLISSAFGRRSYRLVFPESIVNNENLRILLTEVMSFYRDKTSIENFSEEKILSLLGQYHPLYFHENSSFIKSPKYIKIAMDGQLKTLVDILLDKIINQIEPPFSWIEDISHSTEIVKPLVEKCSNHSEVALINLMALLGRLNFSRVGTGGALTVQNIKRILKVARLTDDPSILSGVSVALSTSKFLKSAGYELISKLLKFTDDSKSLSYMLFQLHSIFPDSLEEKELEIIENLADLIMRNSADYSTRVNCAAAKFLAERRRIKLQPLLLEEISLGLEVRAGNY